MADLLDLPLALRSSSARPDAAPALVDPRSVCVQLLEWRQAVRAALTER
jgi:hypothetical protein